MESQYIGSNGGLEGRGKEVEVANKSSVRGSDVILRFLAFASTLVAAIVLGVDKQTKLVSMTVVSTLPPITVPVTAKWHYMSAFVYFVVANVVACAYAALSLLLVLGNRGAKKGLALMIITLDLVMVALLFSGGGAALAVGLIGYRGNSHVQWNKVCNVFGRFCNQVAGAIGVSLLGSAAFLLLVLLAMINLHKKHN
ncbi:CASP-like protein 1E2 [Coffea eugenioides]|uniref:CASP-like protein 1E2 n=1 Tax=Coffea eugenioides TaxID=49369 RepID=UPI000F60BCEC|nr:CASP-like protein 1E2 [Coffea eugenioides]XP_027165391.1 CASP-like protein 1E2 [Coffea eugenioides]